MYYLLLDGFAELLNDNFRPPSIKLDQADEQSSLELNLLIWSDTINLSLQLIRNVVRISHTAGGGFSRCIV